MKYRKIYTVRVWTQDSVNDSFIAELNANSKPHLEYVIRAMFPELTHYAVMSERIA